MEQVIAPPEINTAMNRGDLAAIKAWVTAGGDPNAKIPLPGNYGRISGDPFIDVREPLPPGSWYESVLTRAANGKEIPIIQC
jgi:hypothetical protein